jgi:hypothetical protein
VIAKSNAVLTLENLRQEYDGSGKSVSAVTVPPGLNVTLTYDGKIYDSSVNAPTNAGSYTVIGTVVETNYAGGATNTLEIVELLLSLGVPQQTAEEIESSGFRLRLSANLPGTYLIQRTTDFNVWEDVQEVIYTSSSVEVTNHDGLGARALFYRAVHP